jgi:hypothetical protein
MFRFALAPILFLAFAMLHLDAPAAYIVSAPRNLSSDPLIAQAATVAVTQGGDVIVAWEAKVNQNGARQDVFVRVAPSGQDFGDVVNLTHNASTSRDPLPFVDRDDNALLFFADTPPGLSTARVFATSLSAGVWLTPTQISTAPNGNAHYIDAAQASDGALWLAWSVSSAPTYTNIWAAVVGQAPTNLSDDGSAFAYPAMAADEQGNVFVAWYDRANEYHRPKPGIKVRQWNGAQWLALPDPRGGTGDTPPQLGYAGGQLYVWWYWRGIHRRTWDGAAWSKDAIIAPVAGAQDLDARIAPNGDEYFVWDTKGVIYFEKNTNAPVAISPGVSNALKPHLAVDATGKAHVVFQDRARTKDIWYVTVE